MSNDMKSQTTSCLTLFTSDFGGPWLWVIYLWSDGHVSSINSCLQVSYLPVRQSTLTSSANDTNCHHWIPSQTHHWQPLQVPAAAVTAAATSPLALTDMVDVRWQISLSTMLTLLPHTYQDKIMTLIVSKQLSGYARGNTAIVLDKLTSKSCANEIESVMWDIPAHQRLRHHIAFPALNRLLPQGLHC